MYSINEIKKLFESCQPQECEELIALYQSDNRKGVKTIVRTYKKKLVERTIELERLHRISSFERDCFQRGFRYIAGIDEVGRGPLAGPVVTAAVILPENCLIEGVNDSKKLSEAKREQLYIQICENAIAYSFGIVSSQVIDEINILQATIKAMEKAVDALIQKPDYILIDALKLHDIKIPQKSIIKGDEKSISIGAASIIAKVTRDHMMVELDALYPEYGFARNKGYGSADHITAIKKYGLCPIHRRSFTKNIINECSLIEKE